MLYHQLPAEALLNVIHCPPGVRGRYFLYFHTYLVAQRRRATRHDRQRLSQGELVCGEVLLYDGRGASVLEADIEPGGGFKYRVFGVCFTASPAPFYLALFL